MKAQEIQEYIKTNYGEVRHDTNAMELALQVTADEFEVDTKGLIEYGILVYWTATLSENYVIHNHPSRIGKQNHSYYQRILNIYNPSKRLKNKVTFILDLDYDDEAHEDKPCQNLKITVN